VKIPGIVYISVAALALPLSAGAFGSRRLTPARKWILVWCAFLLTANLGMLVLAHQRRNNHWLPYIVIPIAGGVVLWALSLWQTSSISRLCLRLLVPVLLVSWVGIVITVENTETFSLLADPVAGLLVLGGAIYTLASRALRETGSLLEKDWLWIGVGLVLFWGTAVALPPMSHWLVGKNPEVVVKAYEVKALIEIVALLAITRGILCPIEEAESRGSREAEAPRSQTAAATPTSRG
jgi:hypothetical protein